MFVLLFQKKKNNSTGKSGTKGEAKYPEAMFSYFSLGFVDENK
jgi:hypothetical protein